MTKINSGIGMNVMQEGRYKKMKFWKMAILSYNFNINFGRTLAPGSSLSNTLRTKLHAWPESSIIVEFMVKFIWQHNLPVGFYGTFKTPPGRLSVDHNFWPVDRFLRHTCSNNAILVRDYDKGSWGFFWMNLLQ